MKTKVGSLYVNGSGALAIEFENTPNALRWLFENLAAPALSNKPEMSATAAATALKQNRRGGGSADSPAKSNAVPAQVAAGYRLRGAIQPFSNEPDRKGRPYGSASFYPTPQEERDIRDLLYDIHSAVDEFWRLDTNKRSLQSRSATYRKLLEMWYATITYRAAGKKTLGTIDKRQSVIHTLVRDGMGRKFLEFVRTKVQVYSSQMVRV